MMFTDSATLYMLHSSLLVLVTDLGFFYRKIIHIGSRLTLLKLMEKVGDKVAYTDTGEPFYFSF